MKKKSFILYTDAYAGIKKLSTEEKGLLLDCIFTYAENKTLLPVPQVVEIVFDFIKASMDYNDDRYISICERNRKNIQKRWNKQQDTTLYKPIPPNTNLQNGILIDSDTGIDSDNEIDYEKENILSDNEKKKSVGVPFEQSKYFMGDNPPALPESFFSLALQKGFTQQQALDEFQKFTAHWLGMTGKTAIKSNRGWKMAFCTSWLLNAKRHAILNGAAGNILQTTQNYPTDEEKKAFLGRTK